MLGGHGRAVPHLLEIDREVLTNPVDPAFGGNSTGPCPGWRLTKIQGDRPYT